MHKIISGPCSSANFVIILFYLFCFCVKYYNCLPTAFSQSNSNHDRPMDYTDDVANYLMQFGYLPQSNPQAANLRTITQFEDAIKSLQQFGNIPVTGVVDSDTQKLMLAPRCGTSDIQKTSSPLQITTSKRTKRYALVGTKWQHTDLTWCLKEDGEIRNGDPGNIRRILTSAFAAWAKDSKLTFREIRCSSKVDVEIKFASRDHGDSANFDGPGLILAHAFYPGPRLGGDIHFDSDEEWVYSEDLNEGKGVYFRGVAIHEIGHALGFQHTYEPSSVMLAWYNGYRIGTSLPTFDLVRLQLRYGANPNARVAAYVPKSTTRPTTKAPYNRRGNEKNYPYTRTFERVTQDPRSGKNNNNGVVITNREVIPDKCSLRIDGIVIYHSELYIFSGHYQFRRMLNGELYTSKAQHMWRQLPRNRDIDAVYENPAHEIVFFMGTDYYVFQASTYKTSGTLQSLGLPENITKLDAAFVWPKNQQTYIFSGRKFWKFNEMTRRVEQNYPRSLNRWAGIGYDIDSVLTNKTDGHTYFFKDKHYWRFNDTIMQVENIEPRPSSEWLRGCADAIITEEADLSGKGWKNLYSDELAEFLVQSESRGCSIMYRTFNFILSLIILYLL